MLKRPRNNTPPKSNNTKPNTNARRRVKRRPSTRATPGPNTPEQATELRYFPNARGEYTVEAWEGDAMLPWRVGDTFAKLCPRKNSDIDNGYMRDVLSKASRHRRSTFLFAAVHSAGRYIAALAHCTLHSGMPGIGPRRIVFIDLVCSDGNRKGVGAVLLTELEAYARDVLGARALVLQSVLTPSTQAAYYARRFKRGVGDRSTARLERARMAFQVLNAVNASGSAMFRVLSSVPSEVRQELLRSAFSAMKEVPTAQFKEALRGEYYPAYNTLYDGGDSFVMTKLLTGRPNKNNSDTNTDNNTNNVGGTVAWGARAQGLATFRSPQIRVLARFKRNARTGRIERL